MAFNLLYLTLNKVAKPLSFNFLIYVVVQSLSRVPIDCSMSGFPVLHCLSLLKFMSIELVMPSNHLILCHTLLLLPSIFPSIRVLSKEMALPIKWPKHWSFSISPSNKYSGVMSFRIERFGVNYNTHYLKGKIKLLNSYKMLKIKVLDGLVSG